MKVARVIREENCTICSKKQLEPLMALAFCKKHLKRYKKCLKRLRKREVSKWQK